MLCQSWKSWSLCGAAIAALPLAGLYAEEKPEAGKPTVRIVVGNDGQQTVILGEGKEGKEGEKGQRFIIGEGKEGEKGQRIIVIGEEEEGKKVRKTETRSVKEREEREEGEEGEERKVLALSPYWLGLELEELSEVVRAQLGLRARLAVESVVPESPAAKAGIKAHDILLKVGDKWINEPIELMKAVGEAKDKEITLTIVRGGKETTIKATPAKRPTAPEGAAWNRIFEKAIAPPGGAGEKERAEATKRLEEALAKLQTDMNKAGGNPVRMFFARPGVVGRDVLKAVEFPKNLTVTITKEGDKPARIHVKRDDKVWDVTADKLNELPEDIRVHVQPMVEGGPIRMAFSTLTAPLPGAPLAGAAVPGAPSAWTIKPGQSAPGATPNPAPQNPAPLNPAPRAQTFRVEGAGQGVEAKLEAILKKLDQIESKAVEQLQNDVKQLKKELDELRKK